MPSVRIDQGMQISLPAEVISSLCLEEGDLFQVEIKEGKIVLARQKEDEEEIILSPEDQDSLKRGLDDLKHGRVKGPFTNAIDLITSLNS